MYKRILLPTDGSEASRRAIGSGVRFAQELGAEVIGVTATPEFHTFTLDPEAVEATQEAWHGPASRLSTITHTRQSSRPHDRSTAT